MTCAAHIFTKGIHRHGDNILLTALLERAGMPIADIESYDIRVVLSSDRAVFRQYTYKDQSWGADAAIADIDENGYIALNLTSDTTKEMGGQYYAQFLLSNGSEAIQSPIVPIFEVTPSIVHAIQ